MKTNNLFDTLKQNAYPGRGIVLGTSADGASAVAAYFIMGRSENSRNRVFVTDGDGIRTQAFDPSKMVDPSLIIYAPVRVLGDTTIVTNGDQTDTVYDQMLAGKTFEESLRIREFEPDAPNYTPRISGIIERKDGYQYALSILKSADGNPLPSFEGEPEKVAIEGDIDTFTNAVWDSLNPENKVSLFVRFIDLKTGKAETRIVNKNQ